MNAPILHGNGPNECQTIIAALKAERDALRMFVFDLKRLVNEQAENDGLWFVAEYITEAYLQEALRRLHEAIENHAKP